MPSAEAGERLSAGRWLVILTLVAFGVFYLMLAAGGASFVHECRTVLCAQLHQAVFAAIGAVALFLGAHRVFEGKSAAAIVFFGTLPILAVHIALVMTDPNEAMFFPLSTTPPPLVSAVGLVYSRINR